MNKKPAMPKKGKIGKRLQKRVVGLAKKRQKWIDNMHNGTLSKGGSTSTTNSIRAVRGGTCSGK